MNELPNPTGEHINTQVLGWSKFPYGVRLPEDPEKFFTTLLQQEAFAIAEGAYDENDKKYINDWFATLRMSPADVAAMKEQRVGQEAPVHPASNERDKLSIYEMPNYTDTRVGGNDAINPYWQFNRDDDIIPRMLKVPGVTSGGQEYGMGRVYSERYDSNQQILWLCMGVAEFTDLISFYMDAGDADAAKVMNNGSLFGFGSKILKLAISATVWAFTMPLIAPFWLYRWVNRSDASRITKYYWFMPAMTIYYEMVNTMLSYLAVGMGLYPVFFQKRMDSTKMLNADTIAEAKPGYQPIYDAWGGDLTDAKFSSAETGIPELLKDGPDIFMIMNRRVKLFNSARAKITTRDLIEASRTEEKSKELFSKFAEKYEYVPNKDESKLGVWKEAAQTAGDKIKNLYSNIKGTMFGAGDFVGFKVERSSNASESVNNETGPTSIAQKLNSVAQKFRDEYEDSMGGNIFMRFANKIASEGSVGNGVIEALKSAGIRSLSSMASVAGFGDVGAIVSNGNGYFDIPDVWKGSSFNKSYSFSVELYARYGDPVSIYQSVYIPLIMLLGASLPRAIGTSMYTSPFLIKAFCKGQFAIPCGVVTNISITRGKEEHGWSAQMLPTQVSVSLDIKDMTPAMFIGMQDIGFFDTMSRNESLHEYLDTLSSLGVSERLFIFPQAIRKASAALLIKRNTVFSSTYWGSRMGRTGIAKAVAYLAPFGNHEKQDLKYNPSTYKMF